MPRLLRKDLPEVKATLTKTSAESRDFWISAMLTDLELLEAIVGKKPTADALQQIAEIIWPQRSAAARANLRRSSSNSVFSHRWRRTASRS